MNGEALKVAGVRVVLEGRELRVSPLSSRLQVQYLDEIQKVTAELNAGTAGIGAMVEVFVRLLGGAIRRNHPEVTDEQIFDGLDLFTLCEVVKQVVAATGAAR